MGVDRTDYLFWGMDVGADEFDYDKHEAEADGAPGCRFNVVYDGMGGKYAIAGKIIASSGPYEGFEFQSIKPDNLSFDKAAVASAVAEAFPNSGVSPEKFGLILFSHFS